MRLAHIREWLRTGLWFVPGLFVLGAISVAIATLTLDRHLHDPGWLAFGGGATSAELILATIATSMMTFTGLVFTITIVALQLASSQFSPRVLRAFLRDRGSQVPLGIFAATFVYALVVLREVRTGAVGAPFVPGISIAMAFALVLISLGAFIYYVNHIAQSIRAVNILEAVAHETRAAIDENYPPLPSTERSVHAAEQGPCDQVVVLEQTGGVLDGIEIESLVGLATRHDCLIRMLPAVGDFVAQGAPIFEVYGSDAIAARDFLVHVDVGRERTMYQDPAFGFRQLVDIAEKALSPAINDPTTAVEAIDRLHDLLLRLAPRPDPSGHHTDDAGHLRFLRRVIGWETFVTLAFEEIRQYGAASVQVQRRLRASVHALLDVVTPERRPPLERQMRLLERSVALHFPDPEEHQLAIGSDDAGMGGDLHR
ncbi:MAG TPA: DUF2254 domain-containing protein [Acidimicrobiia bacterium]|nr:DUF2254 domain-containing protein [Acidimicrobiia bacterium]